MARVELPKSKYHVHPAGQHTGFFFEIEGPVQKDTRYGPKMKMAFKIESETAMMPQDAGDYAGEPQTVWLWTTLSKSPKGNLRKFREKILGRKLTNEETKSDDFDPEKEFLNKRIVYVVEHVPSDDPGKPYANIETFLLADDQAPCISRILERREESGVPTETTPTHSISEIKQWVDYLTDEEQRVFGGDQKIIDNMRRQQMGTTDINVATMEMLVKYSKMFKDDDDDTLPF